jgi:hypothetical protein
MEKPNGHDPVRHRRTPAVQKKNKSDPFTAPINTTGIPLEIMAVALAQPYERSI